MTNRTEIVALAAANQKAWDRFHFNANKLKFMSYTKSGVYAFEAYGAQLDAMHEKAKEARDIFTAAVSGMSAEEIAAIVVEGMGA
jgi:arabinogalactan endo-1,4-beta-galactosidase